MLHQKYPLHRLGDRSGKPSGLSIRPAGILPKAIYKSAGKLLERMRHEPIFQGVNSDLEIDTPQINVSLLRDQASQYGITATDVENLPSASVIPEI